MYACRALFPKSSRCIRFSKQRHNLQRCWKSSNATGSNVVSAGGGCGAAVVVDLRSDTVTAPSHKVLQTVVTARTGDDVYGEDPTVLELEEYAAGLFGKERGLYVPTGTMANLVAILAHCDRGRASEIIVGASSHICLWEGGNVSNIGGIHSKQIYEDQRDGTLEEQSVRDLFRTDLDDHWAKTELLCLENTHNMLGGIAFPPSYIDSMGALTKELGIALHIDGARIFNAIVAHDVTPAGMCKAADTVSICLSKGLGAPLGSVLVGSSEIIRLAKRARKRCGGGMRQAGVVAAMGLHVIQNNVDRLRDDHRRAKRLATKLLEHGFYLPNDGRVDTNIVFFGLPLESRVAKEDVVAKLNKEYGVKITGGYGRGGKLFRACTHLDVNDEDTDRALEAIVELVQ